MKLKLLMILVTLVAALSLGFAQEKTGTMKTKMVPVAAKKATPMYACMKCEMASMKAGKCPMCKTAMTKISATKTCMCPKCKMTGVAGSMCPMDKTKMVAAAMTYVCDHCHTNSAKAGDCPKCGMAMTKKVMPLSKGK